MATSHPERTHLPVLSEPASSLRADGSRNWVHPADVKGKWTRLRRIVFVALIVLWAVLPWIEIGGQPAVFLDIDARKFYLFGATFNAQDFWLAFFLLTGVGFALIFMTALLGRVWCGYACPQTVFLEGVYRRIERFIEGPRNMRLKLNAGPITFGKVWRKGLKHFLFVFVSILIAHIVLSYFVSLPATFEMVGDNPADHPEAFAWVAGLSAVLYLNYAWFREQLCLIVCPYGRLQSVLTDDSSIIVGYDEKRGEPRGKAKDPSAGDCVDCNRCVVVCPTGIDIRNGLQLDCIGCAACIDACDEIMTKLDRPTGLIRYDSLAGLEGGKTRFIRPRMLFYAVLGVIGLVVASFAMQSREPYEANLLRMQGMSFVLEEDGEVVRNSFQLHLVNKENAQATFHIEPVDDRFDVMITRPTLEVPSLEGVHVPVFVRLPRDQMEPGREVRVRVRMEGAEEERVVTAPFLGPQ